MEQRGLVLINTGNGKGKTTAALGTAVRAWGNGQRVLILQFIKGSWKYGELEAIRALEKLNGKISLRSMGDGFVSIIGKKIRRHTKRRNCSRRMPGRRRPRKS